MKIKRTALFAFLSFFAFSCSQTDIEPESIEATVYYGDDIIVASAEQPSPSTRTALLDDSTTVVWSSGDKLSLFSLDGQKNTFELISGANESTASFAGTISGTAPYYAFYPASEDASIADGALSFKLPDTQQYTEDTFGPDASPALAMSDDPSKNMSFSNLCGLLCLNLQANGGWIKKIVIHDLAGNNLWGDVKVSLNGFGTSEQKMEVTGGNNQLTLEMPSPVKLIKTSPKKFYFVVPQGTLDRGFAAVIYAANGKQVYTIIQTQNPAIAIERSRTSNMEPFEIIDTKTEETEVARRGYYKDIFMDGGIALTSRTTLPAATSLLGWKMEYIATSGGTLIKADTTTQKALFSGDGNDPNGVLLYPDGEPRFRCIYINGGKSPKHGESLELTGRQRIYDFVYNGGGYVGTCAGALIASNGYDGYDNYQYYLNIYPGHTYHTGMSDTYTDHKIVSGSPLLKYSNFGGDGVIASVYHNGGCYMSTAAKYTVEGTEKLLTYSNCPSGYTGNNGRVSCWAYKPNEYTGRMVLIGSHPEGVTSGERYDLMGAMLRYAVDGIGDVEEKLSLKRGVLYDFSAKSGVYAGIGDKQYHHFKVQIPSGAKNVKIDLTGKGAESDLYLSVNRDGFAYFTDSDYVLAQNGATKSLNIKSLEAGTWYISVYCPNTVTATMTKYGVDAQYFKYTGNLEVLKGVPYTLKVDWE